MISFKISASNNIAVYEGNKQYSYTQIINEASRLSSALKKIGVCENSLVIFIGKRTHEILSISIALMQLKAIYLPVSEKSYIRFNPNDYVDFKQFVILHDDIKSSIYLDLINKNIQFVYLSGLINNEYNNTNEFIFEAPKDNIMYIIRTSGTTGKAKSVKIKFNSVKNLVLDNCFFSINKKDRALAIADISFDASIFEIWISLLNRIPLVIISDEEKLDTDKLYEVVKKNEVTLAMFMTPYYKMILDKKKEVFNYINTIIFGGEKSEFNSHQLLNIEKCIERGDKIYSVYGVTEHTILSTYKKIDKIEDIDSVGKIIKGNTLVLQSKDNTIISKDNEIGEVILGGIQCAEGYLGAGKGFDIEYNRRIYKTKDKAMFINGELHIIGRLDNQIKFLGYRIDVEEIKKEFNKIVSNDFVRIISENNQLILFYKGKHDNHSSILEIRGALYRVLPKYSIPNIFFEIQEIPLNKNDKVDENKLIELFRKGPIIDNKDFFTSTIIRNYKIPEKLFDSHTFYEAGMSSLNIVEFHQVLEKKSQKKIDFSDFISGMTISEVRWQYKNEYS